MILWNLAKRLMEHSPGLHAICLMEHGPGHYLHGMESSPQLYGTQSWAFININLYGIWSKALWSPVQDFMELGLGLYRKIMPPNKTVTHHVINKIKTVPFDTMEWGPDCGLYGT